MKETGTKYAYIYRRVSSKKQEKGYSLDAQDRVMNEYAKKHGYIIAGNFCEAVTSGKAGRKQFNIMLKELHAHPEIRTIITEKTDRIYRNFKDYVTLDEFEGLEVHLVVEGKIISDKSNSHEKLMHAIKVVLAKNYIDNLSEEVKKGQKEKIRQGSFPHKAPVGYLNITDNKTGRKTIIVDPEKAPFIKRLFSLYASGAYSVDEIRKILYEEGLNHNGKPYAKSRLFCALKNIFYTGKFVVKGVTYEGNHEPIIDIDLFNAVQKLFNQSKARTHDIEFSYTGLIKCGHCGCQLTAELKKGKYIYYHCTGKRGGTCKKDWIREEELDEVFLALINKIPNPEGGLKEFIKNIIKDMRKMKGEFEETSTEEIQKSINRLTKRIDNLYADKLDGTISEEFWKEKHELWYAEKDTLLNKLRILNNTSKNFDEGSNLLSNFVEHAPRLFKTANVKTKQQILKLIGSNFIYKDKKLSVELSSVFDLLINSTSVLKLARNRTKSELYDFVIELKKVLSQDFISKLKSLDIAA